MNIRLRFSWPFRKSAPVAPTPQPVRYVVATANDNAKVRRAKASVETQLAVYNATTSVEQRRAETEAFFAVSEALFPNGRAG